MKWLFYLPLAVVALVGLAALLGARLPRTHTATRQVEYPVSAATLYSLIRDVGAAPGWRRDVHSIVPLAPRAGRPCYQEITRHGAITYVITDDVPERHLVTAIDDPALPFGGTWTFELIPTANGTTLRLTERGEVKNVLFRFLTRYLFGYTRTLDRYLEDLSRKLDV